MIDQLKDLKDTFEAARLQIDRNKEPLEDLIKLADYLKAIHADPQAFLENKDKDYQKYFFEDFTNGVLKRLTRERSRDDKYLDVISSVLETYTHLFIDFLNLGVYNQQFFDSMKFLFEHDSILHNYQYQIPEEQLKNLRSANQEWRKALQKGDMVDAISDQTNSRCSGWAQARISSVNGDILQLEFIYDIKAVDKYMDRWSVEIAQFESKTKEIWEWKTTVAINMMVDANDNSVWNKSTILDIKEQQIAPDRIVKMAFIGYRVYVENGSKSDERGSFEGWSSKFDEWISIYSPRIMPFLSKTLKGTSDDLDLDEELDNLLQPDEGFTRVYAVPRIRKCISSVFMKIINLFGNSGGFDLILNILQKSEAETNEEGTNVQSITLNAMASLIQCIAYPYLVYHKEFISEFGPKLVNICIKALRDAPEKSLRDVRREKIESIIKSVDSFQRRLITREEREKQTEVLKLEVSLVCLKSSYLERRIQGIRDLNQIIKNLRMFSSSNKAFTAQFLIQWMEENGVFSILFDPKKTHLQIVQRCNDVLKLLLQENALSEQLMEQFWQLTKADYKFEVYKILNECAYFFKQDHINYFFEQIRQIPSEKLAIEEFQCLSELGKFSKDDQFKVNVSEFFWKIICNSDVVKEDLVNNCINKFCEMVKNWDLARKHAFFIDLTKNLAENRSSISSLRLFKGLVKDQKERYQYNYGNSPSKDSGSVSETSELTLAQSLGTLIEENNLIEVVIDNLREYVHNARIKVNDQNRNETRKKLNLVNNKHNHHEEIDERLTFLRQIIVPAQSATKSYKITKVQLGRLYDLLCNASNYVVQSDYEEFLNWCKSSCEMSTATAQILDLNEVGEFFTEKMANGELDLKNLMVVGFDFLQQYFISVNESQGKIMKIVPVKTANKRLGNYGYQTITYGYNALGQYGQKSYNNVPKQSEEEAPTQFKIVKIPQDLDQLDIVWNMALNCDNPKVVPKAIDFLIRVYYSIDSDLDDQKLDIQDTLIDKCMQILRESKDQSTIIRVIEIIKNIVFETEKKGTGDVKPHNALLKGELLENITIRNKTSNKSKNILMKIYSNATVWEFKKEVSKSLELAPQYLKLEITGGRVIKDIENGKTLAQLGFQSNDFVTAYKVTVEEEIPNAALIGPDGKLSEKANQIFNEWFDMYSDDSGAMTKETCALFIKGCTGEQPQPTDDRIVNMFKKYDSNADGKIERAEFLQFYVDASRSKGDTVRENLKSHNIRNDLKKLSEIQEESSFSTEDMPRYKISKNQEQFNLLISLLDRQDLASQSSWDLIQMLATNQDLYKKVLQLETALDPTTGQIDWSKFFDSQSVYKLLYTLQIVEAVMEEGEGDGLECVVIVEDIQDQKKKNVPNAPPLVGPLPPGELVNYEEPKVVPLEQTNSSIQQEPLPQALKKHSTVVRDVDEDRQLRSGWTSMFLKNRGFQYILKVFMEKSINTDDQNLNQFELKHVAFLLKLLRIFISAAFSTSSNSQIYDSLNLIRRSSNVQEDEQVKEPEQAVDEFSRFAELQKLLQGPIGEEIISQIDYKQLQQKILNLILQILTSRRSKHMSFEDKLIVENALSLWVGCILHKNELLNDFYQFQSDDFILQGLLFCEQEKVREEFKLSLGQLAQKLQVTEGVKETPLIYMLRLLSDKFSLISNYHCKQYFELFCELIDHYFNYKSLKGSESQEEVFNPETLLGLIIDKIQEYNKLSTQLSLESASPASDETLLASGAVSEQEQIYIGLIQLTGKIIDNFDISFSEKIVEQKNLIDEIFVKFLFASIFQQDSQNSTENLRIKPKQNSRSSSSKKGGFGKKSKDAAYKLLNSLIKKSPLLMNSFLEKSMVPLMNLIRRHDGWNYSPPGLSEKQQKYVGLRNLGCICYLNSMLQQFFMIPAFRYNLLCVDDKISEDIQEYKGVKYDDNVLHQLQKLMAHLELSDRTEYNPVEFCYAFKDLDGNPTNTAEQKDAQEFLNLSFDRIENLLRPTTQKYLLQSVFSGQTCSQMVCQECQKTKNRIEDFYNLSLTVKDTKSIYDSLQKLVEGEVINDYNCENCKKKVDISRRTLISQAPNVLIVHLQRILFNFETFRNDKINTYFEFPYTLDLKPYSFYEVMRKENRLKNEKGEDQEDQEAPQDEDNIMPEEETCYEYKLVGVNVHSGTANAGHYWSFINTRRGAAEPDEDDPEWGKTENDPWMKFNDSTVSEYNVEKLKDDCYGGDGKSGGDGDSWSFGGSYGQSAYMLVYEKRQKRPLKILATVEEVETNKDKLLYDAKKEEHYKLIDYREGVEDIAPNGIYKQVFEDNHKFEFENDIYSNEFYEFVRQIILAVHTLDKDRKHQDSGDLKQAKQQMLQVGKKTILDLLAKSFHNNSIKQLVEAMIDVMNKDDSLCSSFLESCFRDDDCNYLFDILLECNDNTSRLYVATLMKFVLNKLKEVEKSYLNETEEITTTNVEGEQVTVTRHKALSARFINKALELLKTKVAKNWSRFDHFLDLIHSFAMDSSQDSFIKTQPVKLDMSPKPLDELVGLLFLAREQFILKACDFILGKKSPLMQPNEKRIDMGGYNAPNFTPFVKLITTMISNEEILERFPLSEQEKKLVLHQELLKVMLGAASGAKQFGICLANMCKNNLQLSRKVSKVFIKAFNTSNGDNLKSYLKALKPFLRIDDEFKQLKLEWVFGFPQINHKKTYREDKYKYGVELIDRINEDAYTYMSPLISGINDESLFSQLLKCKNRQDTNCIQCLLEMLSLMSKDEDIARFVYNTAPVTYQTARFTDWFRPYLESQLVDSQKSYNYSGFFKNKYDNIVKALGYLVKFEEKTQQFRAEELAAYEKDKAAEPEEMAEIEKDWLVHSNTDVIPHYPPRYIIGRQTAEDREFMVIDDNPNVKVTIYEVACEYNYSNPTNYFNISLPHIEAKTNNYQTMSYVQFKRLSLEKEREIAKLRQEQEAEANQQDATTADETANTQVSTTDVETSEVSTTPATTTSGDPQEQTFITGEQENQTNTTIQVQDLSPQEELPVVQVVNWFENHKQTPPVLLRVLVTNKNRQRITVKISFSGDETTNIDLPKSSIKDIFFDNDTRTLCHLQKINPQKLFGELKVNIEVREDASSSQSAPMNNRQVTPSINISGMGVSISGGYGTQTSSFISCWNCRKMNDFGMDYCDKCGESLNNMGDIQEEYFKDPGMNFIS